jgi:deoxyadenosine/deoxycytidine kinase
MRALNIIITGNIASGKTTLTQLASKRFENACYVAEPYEVNPFLPLYLQDQKRWGFTSATHYFWDYAREYAEIVAKANYDICFVDAGTWTNRLVYGEYLYHEGIISRDEYDFYDALCQMIEKTYQNPKPDGFVFVNASPQTCWARMHQRGWAYQTSAIQPSYIEKLDGYLNTMKQAIKPIPMMEISSEAIDFTTPEGAREAIRRLEAFLALYQRPHP